MAFGICFLIAKLTHFARRAPFPALKDVMVRDRPAATVGASKSNWRFREEFRLEENIPCPAGRVVWRVGDGQGAWTAAGPWTQVGLRARRRRAETSWR